MVLPKIPFCRECNKSKLEFILEMTLKLAKPNLKRLSWTFSLELGLSQSQLFLTITWEITMEKTYHPKNSSNQNKLQNLNAFQIF
jgi:hypothetical protein